MRRNQSPARTAEAIMANLDSFIYRTRAATFKDPVALTVRREQADVLISWAKARVRPQDKVTLRPDGSLEKYHGIEVRVRA